MEALLIPSSQSRLKAYWPLAAVVVISGLMASALAGANTLMGWMHAYMGVFLCIFALLKLFNPSGFVSGLQKYDPLARTLPVYAYVYPYIELALGLGYLSHALPELLYIATIAVFGWGAFSVLSALRKGLNVNCPCMGTVLKVPLSTVTLTEDAAMILMAATMLFLG